MKINKKFSTGALTLAIALGAFVGPVSEDLVTTSYAAELEDEEKAEDEVDDAEEDEDEDFADDELEDVDEKDDKDKEEKADDKDEEKSEDEVDKTELKKLIADAETASKEKEKYSETSLATLNEKLVKAQEVDENTDATKEDVDTAVSELRSALNALNATNTEASANAKTGVAGLATVGAVLAASGAAFVTSKRK